MLEKIILLYAIGCVSSMIIHIISWNLLYKVDELSAAILNTDIFTKTYELIKVSLLWFVTIPNEVSYIYIRLRHIRFLKNLEKEANKEVKEPLSKEQIDKLLEEFKDQM